MNWFKTAEFKELSKFALDWKNQEGDWHTFGAVTRYSVDAYSIKLFFSKTDQSWVISLITSHAYLGTAQYCVFWRFDLNKEKHARSIWDKINGVVKDTCKEFVTGERPTSLFDPTLRSRIQRIADPDLVRTNIPIINYSYDIDYEPDWDRNIYGGRYPTYKEQSFAQYLNNSIYSKPLTGKFAL